jgi:hypothetical protein
VEDVRSASSSGTYGRRGRTSQASQFPKLSQAIDQRRQKKSITQARARAIYPQIDGTARGGNGEQAEDEGGKRRKGKPSPVLTTGQLFLHSWRHFLGLHLSSFTIAIRVSRSAICGGGGGLRRPRRKPGGGREAAAEAAAAARVGSAGVARAGGNCCSDRPWVFFFNMGRSLT